MSERPIIFSDDMVRGILSGRKTQTRRVVKGDGQQATGWFKPGEYRQNFQPYEDAVGDRGGHRFKGDKIACPYGQPGDLLWVREGCWLYGQWREKDGGLDYAGRPKRTFDVDRTQGVRYEDDTKDPIACWGGPPGWSFRPSIHMPKWAARLWLRVVHVRVERLQEISRKDAAAEGVCIPLEGEYPHWWRRDRWPQKNFASLWDSINAKRGHGWDTNPWVWVVTFERVES